MDLTPKDQKVQDAVSNNWVDRYAPESVRPYLRLSRFDRPVGAWLLFLPCIFGAAFAGVAASAPIGHWFHFVIVVMIGSWLMRGAGCTWNDIVDRQIDAQVERTKSRPIPSGAVSVYRAGIWMAAQMIVALMALATLELKTILTAIASLVIVAIYPFAKRFTNWPQIVLGLAFNWGVILAYVELNGAPTLGMLALYVAMIFWTLYYDTIYAFQDIRDDEQIGVKSTARALKANPVRYLQIFAGLMLLALLLATSLEFLFAPLAVLAGFIAGALVFYVLIHRQLKQFDPESPALCLVQFRQNVQIGQVVAVIWTLTYILLTFY